jgi:glycosyltransferase involved in cell wall biosynthesis
MNRQLVYDISRLVARINNPTPNGIDRVDLAFARRFLGAEATQWAGCVYTKSFGFGVLPREVARDIVESIHEHLGEDEDPEREPAFCGLKAWLAAAADSEASRVQRVANPPKRRAARVLDVLRRHGLAIARSLRRELPRSARYLNVSQYPLDRIAAADAFASRPDLKPAFFIHDLLPLQAPEYFKPSEYERHRRRLANLARIAAGAIVSSEAVREDLTAHLKSLGRADLPILRPRMPISPIFAAGRDIGEAPLARTPYFVLCGTIEPRKNHLMILHVWRELARRRGRETPKLLLIGARGWENENVLDMLDRCPQLRGCVLEVSGLSTPALKRVVAGAAALLMPSFAEGFGLPVAEALAVGAPVIASDLPVFREIAGGRFTPLSPLDALGWLAAIESHARMRPDTAATPNAAAPADDAFAEVEAFLASV